MSEPVHCPYLGLRQNRAIRFAAPTPEHRCYREGTPVDIPVDQRTYCLSAQHRTCPLYTGQWDASMQGVPGGQGKARKGSKQSAAQVALPLPQTAPRSTRSWNLRSVIFYAVLVVVGLPLVLLSVALYRSLPSTNTPPSAPGDPSPTISLPVVVPPIVATMTATPTASASALPQPTATVTPTVTLTPVPSPSSTVEPTFPPIPTITVPIDVPEPTFAFPTVTPPLEEPTDEPPVPTEEVPEPSVAPTEEVPTEIPPTEALPTEAPTIPAVPTEITSPPTPQEPTATIVLQLTVLPLQRP